MGLACRLLMLGETMSRAFVRLGGVIRFCDVIRCSLKHLGYSFIAGYEA